MTPNLLDVVLHDALTTAASNPDGRLTMAVGDTVALPNGRVVRCAPLALGNRMLERAAFSTGPDALSFPGCGGGDQDLGMCFTLPHKLGQLDVSDVWEPVLHERHLIVAWGAPEQGSRASAHTRLAWIQWLDRFFQDILA